MDKYRRYILGNFATPGQLLDEFSRCAIFANENNIPPPVAYFVLEIRWRLRIVDAEPSSNF